MSGEQSPEEALVDTELAAMARAFEFLLPPGLLATLTEEVRLFALSHPGMSPMVARLLPAPVVDASGVVGSEQGGDGAERTKKASGERT